MLDASTGTYVVLDNSKKLGLVPLQITEIELRQRLIVRNESGKTSKSL